MLFRSSRERERQSQVNLQQLQQVLEPTAGRGLGLPYCRERPQEGGLGLDHRRRGDGDQERVEGGGFGRRGEGEQEEDGHEA